MDTTNDTDIKKLIKQMEIEDKQFGIEIEQKKPEEGILILKKFPFFTPFFKAFLLTIAVLFVVICLK